jgi:hypothetical protein
MMGCICAEFMDHLDSSMMYYTLSFFGILRAYLGLFLYFDRRRFLACRWIVSYEEPWIERPTRAGSPAMELYLYEVLSGTKSTSLYCLTFLRSFGFWRLGRWAISRIFVEHRTKE